MLADLVDQVLRAAAVMTRQHAVFGRGCVAPQGPSLMHSKSRVVRDMTTITMARQER